MSFKILKLHYTPDWISLRADAVKMLTFLKLESICQNTGWKIKHKSIRVGCFQERKDAASLIMFQKFVLEIKTLNFGFPKFKLKTDLTQPKDFFGTFWDKLFCCRRTPRKLSGCKCRFWNAILNTRISVLCPFVTLRVPPPGLWNGVDWRALVED